MINPLRYFIDEGFGSIISFLNENGELELRINTFGNHNFLPIPTSDGITIGGTNYVIDDAFISEYTTVVENRQEADIICISEQDNWSILLGEENNG